MLLGLGAEVHGLALPPTSSPVLETSLVMAKLIEFFSLPAFLLQHYAGANQGKSREIHLRLSKTTSLILQSSYSAELHRVLGRGGVRRIMMIYHRWSITVAMLWIVYGSWRRWPIDKTVGNFLEGPGTRVFSIHQAK